jgi:hypothetical protein
MNVSQTFSVFLPSEGAPILRAGRYKINFMQNARRLGRGVGELGVPTASRYVPFIDAIITLLSSPTPQPIPSGAGPAIPIPTARRFLKSRRGRETPKLGRGSALAHKVQR